MPCLSLKNTSNHQETLKTSKLERRKMRAEAKLAQKMQKAALAQEWRRQREILHEEVRAQKQAQLEQKSTNKQLRREQKISAKRAQREQKALAKQTKRNEKLQAKQTRLAQKQAATLAKKTAHEEAKQAQEQAQLAKISARQEAKQAKLVARQAAKAAKHARRARTQSIKQQTQEPASHQPKQAPTVIGPKYQRVEPNFPQEVLYITHKRKPLGTTATVSQTLTAAISAQMRPPVQKSRTPAQPMSTLTPQSASPIDQIPPIFANIQLTKIQKINRSFSRADLINAESQLGSQIFGPVPRGHRREFFHDRQNIWIWHEDWQDETRQPHQVTIRYEVLTSGVYKKVSTGRYYRLEGKELENFRQATRVYLYLIKTYLYQSFSRQVNGGQFLLPKAQVS